MTHHLSAEELASIEANEKAAAEVAKDRAKAAAEEAAAIKAAAAKKADEENPA